MRKRLLIGVGAVFMVLLIATAVRALFAGELWNGVQGDLIAESRSPAGTWLVRGYYVDPGAAASAFVRAEAVDERGRVREFYWEYLHVIELTWQSDDVVVVNGRSIDLRSESYPP